MVNFRGRGRPPKRGKTMDHGSVTVTAGVRVLPQEQNPAPLSLPQHTKFWPIKAAEKEEEWLPKPVQMQQPQTSEPMKPRKRGRPRKIISQSLSTEPMKLRKRGRPRKIISQSLSTSGVVQEGDQNDKAGVVQEGDQNDKAATNRKDQKNSTSRVIRIRVTPDPENTDSSTDEAGIDEKRRVNIPNNIPQAQQTQSQLQLRPHDDPFLSNNEGVVDLVLPRRKRSSTAAVIRRRMANDSNPDPLSSDFGKGILVTTIGLNGTTTVDQSTPCSSSTLELEVPGPIPDCRDLLITDDMDSFFKYFFQDLPQE